MLIVCDRNVMKWGVVVRHNTPLGSNGPHCIEFLHEMRKILLNLVPSEPLSLVKELACFDNSIQLDILLASVLDLCVRDPISCNLFHAIWI